LFRFRLIETRSKMTNENLKNREPTMFDMPNIDLEKVMQHLTETGGRGAG